MAMGIKTNRLVDHVLYSQEKRYRQWIDVHHLLQVDNDPMRGTSSPRTIVIHVSAIVLPETMTRKTLPNRMERRNLSDALYDELVVPVIIRNKRLFPEFTTNDWCIIRGTRYDFKKVETTMDDRSYHILTQQSPAVGRG